MMISGDNNVENFGLKKHWESLSKSGFHDTEKFFPVARYKNRREKIKNRI